MFTKIVFMYKPYLFLLFTFCGTFLAAQEKKPLPDCKDMNEKIITIQKSFDKLLETFRNKEAGKVGIETTSSTETTYSSDFNLCGEKGALIQLKGKSWYDVTLEFTFEMSKYNFSDRENFHKRSWEILKILNQIFTKWHYNSTKDQDEDVKAMYFTFSEGDDSNDDSIKKEVMLNTFAEGDYIYSFKLKFKFSQL